MKKGNGKKTMLKEIKGHIDLSLKEIKGYVNSSLKEIKGYVNSSLKEVKEELKETKRHTGVLVEGLRSEVKLVFEQYGTVIRKLEDHDRRFDGIDRRFDGIDIELKGMKTALFDNSHRLDNHEKSIRKSEMS